MKPFARIILFFIIAVTFTGAADPYAVKVIYVDEQGTLWVATDRGLCRYDDPSWTWYTEGDHLPSSQVNALAFAKGEFGEVLWVATGGGVCALSIDADGVTGSPQYTH